MNQFGLQRDPPSMFPSHRIQIEKVLPCMMKHTFEKFVLPYVNGVISVITTFDLWMNKGQLDIFALVINFLTLDWESKCVTIGLFEENNTIGINLIS
jgi:hypothetical protein